MYNLFTPVGLLPSVSSAKGWAGKAEGNHPKLPGFWESISGEGEAYNENRTVLPTKMFETHDELSLSKAETSA